MLLRHLPEDILAIVLRRCTGVGSHTPDDLKCNLPLLAVCRLWRRLAIPLVYSRAFVRYGEHPKCGTGPFNEIDSVEEPTDVAVKTNLDLTAMVGCARAVRQVQIDVYCLVNPFPWWQEAIHLLRTVASRWRAVELSVAMHPEFSLYSSLNGYVAKYADDIAEVGDELAALMPNVRRLKCGGVNHNPIARSLYGRLVSHYADQLQQLDCQHPITVPQGCHFTGLRGLKMCYDNVTNYQLPQMSSKELVDMSLINGPPNHSWAPFSTDSGSRVIEFAKLKRLRVLYGRAYLEDGIAVHHRDGHPWMLHFPSLESVEIRGAHNICPLLEYALLPPHMESISIHKKSAAYQEFAHLVLPATKHLHLEITSDSRGDPSGLPAVNRILENARGSVMLKLNVQDDMLLVAPESITCTTLTHLQVSAPTSVDTMLAFIERLPNLAKLSLPDLDPSGTQADISVPGADDDSIVETLHSHLDGLSINYGSRRYSPDTAVAVAKYVLLRIPSLSELFAGQTPKSLLLGFVEDYAPRYPHLGSVKLEAIEGGNSSYTRWSFGTWH